MDDSIGISTLDNPAAAPRIVPQSAQSVKSVVVGQQDEQKEKPTEAAAKIEILTKTDIEIRKLHALRRTKEYLEQKLTEAAESEVSGASVDVTKNESAAAIAYSQASKTPAALEISAEGSEIELESPSFKTGTAISGYKSYKKETPKAWEEGAMDEKR